MALKGRGGIYNTITHQKIKEGNKSSTFLMSYFLISERKMWFRFRQRTSGDVILSTNQSPDFFRYKFQTPTNQRSTNKLGAFLARLLVPRRLFFLDLCMADFSRIMRVRLVPIRAMSWSQIVSYNKCVLLVGALLVGLMAFQLALLLK